jgi:molybdopterin/thiamine biosynthesis adenylyltransferase
MRGSREELVDFIPGNFNEIKKNKKLCVIGCGGVGSNLLILLARSEFRNLLVVDFDLVDDNNLSRQSFFESDIGKRKVDCIKEQIHNINEKVVIETLNSKVISDNIDKICRGCDLIVDATDNFETRRVINDYCEREKRDWLYNGAIKSEVASCIFRGEDKLFDKVFTKSVKDQNASCVGILNSTTLASASLAYNKILKYFLEVEDYKLIKIDIWDNKLFEVNLK